MEALSAASSVIAVVGLAGQLLAGIKNITDFWGMMQDIPQDISDAIHELHLLGAVLERIHQKNSDLRQIDPLLETALQSCKVKIDRFAEFTAHLNISATSGGTSRGSRHVVRTWKTFKAALQAEKLKSFRVSLTETKLTLALVRQDLAE